MTISTFASCAIIPVHIQSIAELNVLSIAFLEDSTRPMLGVLYIDAQGHRHFKTYRVPKSALEATSAGATDMDMLELEPGPMAKPSVDRGATFLIPVPQPHLGVIIVGGTSLLFMNERQSLTAPIAPTSIVVYDRIDNTRFVLGDNHGDLFLLELVAGERLVEKIVWSPLGRASIPSTLSYIDRGIMFVGSHVGDAQLVALPSDIVLPPSTAFSGTRPPLPVLDSLDNLAPITDFLCLDADKPGQSRVITCSGAKSNGSLRVIRTGVGIRELGTIDIPSIEGCWALRKSKPTSVASEERYLVMSFMDQTRLLVLNTDNELEEVALAGLNKDVPTIFAAAVGDGACWLQVTAKMMIIVDSMTQVLLAKWHPPAGQRIHMATSTSQRLLLSSGAGHLHVFDLSQTATQAVLPVIGKQLPHDIACIALSDEDPDICAVGMWGDICVCLLNVHTLDVVARDDFGGAADAIPRSLMFVKYVGVQYLLAGMGRL